MPAYQLIIIILICAVVYYFVRKSPKVPEPFKLAILCILVCIVVYYLLVATGLLGTVKDIKVPHVENHHGQRV
jgi:RsiW-degrading membrane proteinase PrsW (M82 family)